jgi:hypothetical protein
MRQRIARLAAAAGTMILALTAVQAVAVTAAAAATIPPGSVQVVSAVSGFSTGPSKTTTAVCPAAKPRVLGGGFTTTGTHIVVTEAQPIAGGPDSYRVTAQADEVGTTASWQLLVYAYCSNVAPGWQLVTATSTSTSNPFNQVIPSCPSGKAVVGTGGQINGGAGQVQLLTQGIGSVAPNRMSAAGTEDLNGFAGSWSVTGYAICVTYVGALDVRLAQNQTAGADPTQGVTVPCPTGYSLTGTSIWTDLPGYSINLRPNVSLNPTIVTGTGRNDSGTPSTGWSVIVYAHCAQ